MKNFETFISCEDSFNLYKSEDLIIIDCRFDLSNPSWGYQDYLKSHIPNALYAHLDNDLSKKVTQETGRHPLPDLEKMEETFSKWGIDSKKQVVVYDSASGSFAARLWWMLHYLGHSKVAILNGGLQTWIGLGYPVESGNVINPTTSIFTGKPNNSMLISTSEMENLINDKNFTIIDARSPERYSGQSEPIDKIAGRIPNSINFFHQENLDESGYLLSKNELKQKYNLLLEEKTADNVVVYCGSGVTSCMNVAVMKHIGLSTPKLYLGSWSEWIRDLNHPIINDYLTNNN